MLQETAQVEETKYERIPDLKSETGSPFDVLKMKLDLVVSETAEIYVFHDRPFDNELSWIEFDIGRCDLNFIFADGDVRNFGLKVKQELAAYMQNAFSVKVVRVEKEEVQDGVEMPLIVHRD